MPTVTCQKCGATLRFEGLAGLCPKCGSVTRVSASAKPASAEKSPAPPPAVSSSRSHRRGPTDLSSLDVGQEEVFAPSGSQIQAGFLAGVDKRIVYGSVAALGLVLLFGLYVAVRPPSSDVAINSAAPMKPAAPIAPAPAPDVPDNTPPPPALQVIQSPMPTTSSTQAATGPAWMALRPSVPSLKPKPITDQAVGEAIKKAAGFLKSQFVHGKIQPENTEDVYVGIDAISVYALLQAGLAIDDSGLSSSSEFIQQLLDQLKTMSITGERSTYAHSLRASALSVYDRDIDRAQLEKDRAWLLMAGTLGRYGYDLPPKGAAPEGVYWDNSNSQYGVLGIWAAVMAGMQVPDKYWKDVEQHWLSCQDPNGGWNYGEARGDSSLSMTCAGVTTLCVTAEQLELIASKGKSDARPRMSAAINRALDYLAKDDVLTAVNVGHLGYELYGVERAALATGYRRFGNHDWYRELGAREIAKQGPDGSFDGIDGFPVETAFRLLFLSRGRQPIFINKLRFDGDWNDRPRDAAKITQFASAQLEKPFAWGVADLNRNWVDWLECPLLFISTDAAPDFSDADCAKLRAYTDAGGLIFLNNEFASREVDGFAASLVKRVYPEYPFLKVAPNDPLYNCDFPIKKQQDLLGVGNGTRLFMAYSPRDITQDWVRFKPKDTNQNINLQLGLNLFVSTAGKTDFHNRLSSPYEPDPDFEAAGTVPVVQIKYDGPWNQEAKAFDNFGHWFQNQTSLKLDVQPTALINITPQQAPLAVLTGNAAVDFSRMDFHALQDFVQRGGVLFIDSTGGSKAFTAAVHDTLMPTAFPEVTLAAIPPSDPILAGRGPCMDHLTKAHLRNFGSMLLNGKPPAIQYAAVGRGAIIISDLDVTTGLLNSGTYGINGYTPTYCQGLMKNVILWALGRYAHQ